MPPRKRLHLADLAERQHAGLVPYRGNRLDQLGRGVLEDLIEPTIRAEIARRALTRAGAVTPVVPEPAGSLPRLRGAIALVAAPAFAAPQIG